MTPSALKMVAQVDQSNALIRQIVAERYEALLDFAVDGRMDSAFLLRLRAIASSLLAIHHAEQHIKNEEAGT